MFLFSGNYVSLKTKPYNFADTNRLPIYLVAIKTVLIVFYFFSTISALSSKKFKFDAISKIQPTMYGSYTILKQNFDSLKNANQVDNNWKQLIIENEGFATVKYNCDITLNYVTSFDSISKSLIFYDEMMNIKYAYLISIIDTNSYILKGQDTFIITKQIVSNNIKLKHFHWINDNTNNK
ncbi:MAG: hypothetical protein IPM92_14610 [Saprospiraceae bacterium]|nr:hypothetical protein [Saprospiraceae bacterium]